MADEQQVTKRSIAGFCSCGFGGAARGDGPRHRHGLPAAHEEDHADGCRRLSAAGEIDFGDSITAGKKAASLNGFTDTVNGVTVQVRTPINHRGRPAYWEQVLCVSQTQKTFFAKIFGIGTVPMTVRAVAAEGGGSNCIFALNPKNTGFSVVALAAVTSPCGIVVDSSSNHAFTCGLLAAVNASSIGIVGNVSSFL